MDLIPSFQVDHNKILPGIYESRLDTLGDEYATTFDIRMKKPNIEPAVHPNAMHTIEHIIATFLRNDEEWKDRIIYWGPMGCLTGCYLIVKGHPTPQEILPLLTRAYEFCANYEGEVPGKSPKLRKLYSPRLEYGKIRGKIVRRYIKEQSVFRVSHRTKNPNRKRSNFLRFINT